MLDHAPRWPAVPDWSSFDLGRSDLRATVVRPASQAYVSGDLDAFRRVAGLEAQDAGGLRPAEGETYAVRLARDRLLAVGVAGEAVAPGWHAAGFAVTPTDAGLLVFAFGGPALSGLVARATIPTGADPGPSAATLFAGLPAVVYRHRSDLRVHVERGLATALTGWLAELPAIL
jgi:hypothetical protein